MRNLGEGSNEGSYDAYHFWNCLALNTFCIAIWFNLSVPEKMKKKKKSVFEVPVIPQTLNINN